MNQLQRTVGCFLGVVTIGITGFVLIERLAWIDAVYLTVATVATVGYGDLVPSTTAGKVFTVLLIVFGVGTAGYTMTLLFSLIVEGHLKNHFGRRNMLREIACLDNHVIVCGAGRVGKQVIAGLIKSNKPFVVIEKDPGKVELLQEDRVKVIFGDAKKDRILQEAGVKRACFLVAALSNDADNVYVTLSAKHQNSNIVVVSRAEDEDAEFKMRQAGAAFIISPSISGGRQMLEAIILPIAFDFFQNMFYNQEISADLEEISICPGSTLIGKSPSEISKQYYLNLFIASIKRDNEFLSAITGDEIMKCCDIIIVVGQKKCIQQLAELASNSSQ